MTYFEERFWYGDKSTKFQFPYEFTNFRPVLLKSLRICKRCYKGSFTLKSNSKR